MKGDILIFNMRYCSLLFTKKLQRYGMINRPSLDQPLYLDISRYLDIFHLDTGYLNISVSKYLFLLYLALRRGIGRERNEYMRENRAEGESEVDVGIH